MHLHTFKPLPLAGKNVVRTTYQLFKRKQGRRVPKVNEAGLGRLSFAINFDSNTGTSLGFVFKKFLRVTVNKKSWIAVPGEQLFPDENGGFALILIPRPTGSEDNALLEALKNIDLLDEVLVIIGDKTVTIRHKGKRLGKKLDDFFERIPKCFETPPKCDILERHSLKTRKAPDCAQSFFDALLDVLTPTKRARKPPSTE